MNSPLVTYDKNGRARNARGRFVSASVAKALTYAETGQVTKERVNGRTFYRGPDGRRVSAAVGEQQKEVRQVIGKGKRRKEIHPEQLSGTKANKPRGYDPAIAMDLRFNSASKAAGDIAANGGVQFIKWRGKFTRISPEKAGALQDVFRAIFDRYIEEFKPYTGSPQLSVPFVETSAGDVYDMDGIETMDADMMEGFIGDAGAEQAAEVFNAYMGELLDGITVSPTVWWIAPAGKKSFAVWMDDGDGKQRMGMRRTYDRAVELTEKLKEQSR